MRIALLGSLQIDDGRTALSPRDRVILLALASRPGAELSTQTLAETLWGEDLPDSWHKVVQGCISRLRKALGPESVQTTAHGYRLTLHREELDHAQFEHLLARARQLLEDGEPERALFVTGQARRLWRGEPFTELADWGPGRVESERLLELSRDAEDLHAEAGLRAGHHRDVLVDASRLVGEQPTRERRWGLLARALYQDGRQGDALQTLHRAKRTLVDELGLDPGPELAELEQAILRQDPALSMAAPDTSEPHSHCPYLGLIAYDVTDASTFFGRESDVSACLRRLGESGVVAILGPSGCGKSSLARAGLGAVLGREGRRVHVLTPGAHPADSLAALQLRPEDVLVVDQAEEALALPAEAPQRIDFVTAVVAFAEAGRGQLIVSMRADRLGELSSHPELARLVESGLYLLGPMSEEDLRRAIEGPAAEAGVRLEPGLTNLIVREVAGEPAALPLLSHVLRQTWRHREGSTLTVEGYDATGGVREAVSQSAEGLFRGLDPRGQVIVRELMLRLVSPDEGGDPVRTRVPRRAVTGDAAHAELVEQLVAARLLASDGETIEIAHESLAVAWPRLRSWLDEDVDGLRTMRHLSVAAESWDGLGRPDSELYRGTRQARAAEWQQRSATALTSEERDFLRASGELAAREQRATEEQVRRERRLNQRLRLGLAATAAFLAVAVILGTVAKSSADRADQQATVAQSNARVADARSLGAEALRSDELDRSLLLAAAAVTVDDSVDSRNQLLATLSRSPALIGSARADGLIYSMSVNPRTGHVAALVLESVIQLFDGATLGRLPAGEQLRGVGVASSPDGQHYALSGWGNDVEAGKSPSVMLLDDTGALSPVQLGGLPAGFEAQQQIGFSPNSRWLAVSFRHQRGEQPTLTGVWDLRSPARPALLTHLEAFNAPTVSNDGRTLYTTGSGTLEVTTVATGRSTRTLGPDDLRTRGLDDVLAQSPDGRSLVVGAGVESVVLDRATLTPRAYLPGQGWTSGLQFSGDGRRLATTGERLIVWDLTGDEPVEVLVQETEVDSPHFSRDGRTVYAKRGNVVHAWDLSGTRHFAPVQPFPALGWGESIARFSPDGTQIAYVATGPARFVVRDARSGSLGQVVTPAMEQRRFIDIAWNADSTAVNVTTGSPEVKTWDAATGRELAAYTLQSPGSVEGAAFAWFTADGTSLLVGSTTGRLHVLDATSLQPARAPIQVYVTEDGEPDPREIGGLAPSGDGRTVYVADAIVDYVNGEVRPIPDLGIEGPGLTPTPDGRRLFVEAGNAGIGLVDARTFEWISRPSAVQARLMGWTTAFSDDGRFFASVSDDHRLSYWDARDGDLLGSLAVGLAGSPSFSKDGSQLRLAGAEGSVLTWDLDPATWGAAACRLAGRDLTEQEWRDYLPNRPYRQTCAA